MGERGGESRGALMLLGLAFLAVVTAAIPTGDCRGGGNVYSFGQVTSSVKPRTL
jgi:hypothetical protein